MALRGPVQSDPLAAVNAPVVRAAGAVLWRPAADGIAEVALVHRPRYDDWSLPKGKLDRGEHPLVAACREVVEETGIAPVAGPRLPTVAYTVAGAPKTVDYWVMRAKATAHEFTPNDEVDGLRWVPQDGALDLLTYAHDRPLVERFAALHPVTGIVLLIRHGKAGSRKAWPGDDHDRPLDEEGQAQAARLAAVLPCYAPERLVSADPVRCVQTMDPLAAALGIEVETDPVFSEEQHPQDPGRAADRLRKLAASTGVVAVCSQGAVIPDVVRQLIADLDLDPESVVSRKGSVWVLSFRGETVVAADYVPNLEP
jgi:phosphohistidine phosphatase SixA/ADP-ribose pyrophosphatase YjhB (NUDIX family)